MSRDYESPTKDLPAALLSLDLDRAQAKLEPKVKELRQGSACPNCQVAGLDYDGMLNLACSHCGYTLSGCFT